MAYDLSVVRQLLEAAFSIEDVDTLTFDLFHELYDNPSPSLNKRGKVKAVVEHARQRGRIEELLAYTRRHNAYQYNQFTARLVVQEMEQAAVPPAEPPAPSANVQRLKRERDRLQIQYDLLAEKARRLGVALAIETDIPRKFQIEQQLKEADGELAAVGKRLDEIEAAL